MLVNSSFVAVVVNKGPITVLFIRYVFEQRSYCSSSILGRYSSVNLLVIDLLPYW